MFSSFVLNIYLRLLSFIFICSVNVPCFCCVFVISFWRDYCGSMEKLGESAIPWMDDDFTTATTSSPEIIVEEDAIGTLIIIIISAIVSITLLFVMAVFIDCRHQKLAKIKQSQKSPKKILRIPIPRFNRTAPSEDQDTLADKMHTEDFTPSPGAVIV